MSYELEKALASRRIVGLIPGQGQIVVEGDKGEKNEVYNLVLRGGHIRAEKHVPNTNIDQTEVQKENRIKHSGVDQLL